MNYKKAIYNKLLGNSNYSSEIVYFLTVVFFGITNLLFYTNSIIMYISIFLQIFMLCYFFIKNDYIKYIMYLTAFVTISLESDVLVKADEWYGFIKTEICGVRLPIILIIPFLLMVFKQRKLFLEKIKKNDVSCKLVKLLIFAYASAIIMGILNIILNNNGIRNLSGYIHSFISLAYFYGFTVVLIVGLFCILIIDKKNVQNIKKYLIMLLFSIGIISLFSIIVGLEGQYDTLEYSLITSSIIYLPMILILVPFVSEKKYKIAMFIFGVISCGLCVVFASSGKILILCLLVPVVFIVKNNKFALNIKSVTIILGSIALAIVLLIIVADSGIIPENTILGEKVSQVLSLINIFSEDYVQNLPLSPKCRVLEVINIFHEYEETPLQLLFGKGFLGSFTDHTGLLTYIGSSFTSEQWEAGIFYLPHESFSRFFLMNGLMGLYTVYFALKVCITNIRKSPWVVGGVIWFLFFYGYSINLSFIGIAMFIVGLIDVDNSKSRKYEVLAVDFMVEDGHRYYCNCLVNSLNKEASTLVVCKEDYYDFEEDENHKKIVVKTKPIPGRNVFESRYNILYNMYNNIKMVKKYRFEKVLVLGYEGLTFFLFRTILKKYGDIYVIQHHQLDELRNSGLKTKVFNLYKNKVKHIVLEPCIRENVVKEYSIPKDNIFVFPVPLLNKTNELKSEKTYGSDSRIVLAISNSNDENFVDEICEYEKKHRYFSDNNYKLIIRTRRERDSIESIRYITSFISTEEYNSLYENAYIVLMPFPTTYVNRSSGTIIDAISMRKRVLCSRILLTEDYALNYPNICKLYDSVEDVVKMIGQFSSEYDLEQCKKCLSLHDTNYQLECIRMILGKKG